MATDGALPVTRELGYVALIAADGSTDKAWALGARSVKSLQDLLNAMPMIGDPGLRASLYPKVLPLLDDLPPALSTGRPKTKGTYGRFIRVALKGRRTLTLAEVEVYSDGRNIARRGKASQKNVSSGGDPSRGIDGNTNPSYNEGGQTHTEENTPDPWWEVDLGAERPIDSVVIFNRSDGLSDRLANFTLTILDGGRNPVYERKDQAAPNLKSTFEVGGGGPEGLVRRAAMAALTSVRGQEGPTFKALAKFVKSGDDRGAAIAALQRIPATHWPAEEAPEKHCSETLLTIKSRRRSPPCPAQLTPSNWPIPSPLSCRAMRPGPHARNRGSLGVRVIRMGTVLDQMLFDKDRFVVQAGKPVEVVFENNDLMPHNFVVTRPGSLEETGILAEETATQPGFRSDATSSRRARPRSCSPPDYFSPASLTSSISLPPRSRVSILMFAPHPGYWAPGCLGASYVVDDLDDYLADPESYLARPSDADRR